MYCDAENSVLKIILSGKTNKQTYCSDNMGKFSSSCVLKLKLNITEGSVNKVYTASMYNKLLLADDQVCTQIQGYWSKRALSVANFGNTFTYHTFLWEMYSRYVKKIKARTLTNVCMASQ